MSRYFGFCAIALVSIVSCLPVLGEANAAGNATYITQSEGATPFSATIAVSLSGSSLSSARFQIQPFQGSLTRPILGTYSANYLSRMGLLSGNMLYIQVFGLYNADYSKPMITNYVNLKFSYTDGSVSYMQVPIKTSGYANPCSSLYDSSRTFHQNRQSTSDLSYDYFLLKVQCNKSLPVLFDTDGYIRWGYKAPATNQSPPPGGGSSAAIVADGGTDFYISDGGTTLYRYNFNTGNYAKLGNLGSAGDTGIGRIGDHNIDFGRNGSFLIGATTNAHPLDESTVLETNTSIVLNRWDFGSIITNNISPGDTTCSGFVNPTTDWYHENSNTYNPADNTIVSSSRENFIIAVDYDVPQSGARKIHWILGDTTKAWYQCQSLRKYALSFASGSQQLPPIGQHSVSFDAHGNLMVINDGANSLNHPAAPGNTYTTSFATKYALDLNSRTARVVYGYASYGGGSYFKSPYCGSAYSYTSGADSYLMDFTLEDPAGVNGVLSNTPQKTFAQVQGLRADNTLVFDLDIPQYTTGGGLDCAHGFNAVPLDLSNLQYN